MYEHVMMKNVSEIIVCLQTIFFESCYFGSKVQEYYYRSSIPCALEDLDIPSLVQNPDTHRRFRHPSTGSESGFWTSDGISKSSLSKSCLNWDHRICIMKFYWPIQQAAANSNSVFKYINIFKLDWAGRCGKNWN